MYVCPSCLLVTYVKIFSNVSSFTGARCNYGGILRPLENESCEKREVLSSG